jgi:outer membrane receptor protein involved in Fe transport
MKNFLLTITLLFCGTWLMAQSQATLRGTVVDKDGETVIGANVVLFKGGAKKATAVTDIDGNYSVNTDGGTYDVEFSYLALQTQRQEKVVLPAGQIVKLNIKMEDASSVLGEVVIKEFKVPLIRQDNTTSGGTITSEQIANLPTRNVSAMVALTPGISSNDGDGNIRVKGSRDGNTIYMVDGIRVNKEALPPAQEIDQLQVITGGVEAQYGDVTGGIVTIQTKGPSAKYSGGVELETSKFLDGYDNNMVNANVSGPIIKRNGQSILGFRLSGNLNQNKDITPSAVDLVVLKPEVLAAYEADPIIRKGGSFVPAALSMKDSDVNFLKARPNDDNRRYDLNGKLDARLTSKIDITLSGQYANNKDRISVDPPSAPRDRESWRLMNYERNPYNNTQRYRTNIRFRHRLGSDGVGGDSKKVALIQNASYTLQAGFENTKEDRKDLIHQDNLFAYGHIGEFKDSIFRTIQFASPDSAFHAGDRIDFAGYKAGSSNPVLANYNKLAAGDQNPLLANFINRNGFQNTTFRDAWSYRNVGQIYNTFYKADNDLLTLNVMSSLDLVPNTKNRHSIQFGLIFEQRTNRLYSLAPFELWQLGGQLANQHFNGLADGGELEGGGKKPLKIIGKQIVDGPAGQLEVPLYAPFATTDSDGKFYTEARKVKGLAIDQHLNIDDLKPEQLSLNMFSARELTERSLLNYYGFDYLGNKLASNVTFEDFFTKTENVDGRNIRTLPLAAQRPNYTAAFIQDKFTIKDIIFRLGLRVDRYDANTKVLRDPYSLYEIIGANDFYSTVLGNAGGRPGTIGNDYKVYVKDPTAVVPSVLGFRNGEQWFDAKGNEVNNPNVIFQGGVPEPYYADNRIKQDKNLIKSKEFDTKAINGTFKDYAPQINIMPRLAFSFPISDEANFFANYDVLVSRPTTNAVATALDYFYFTDAGRITENDPIDNPDLKPEKTIYYEVGFQQKLTNSSALKLTAYYKELRDMVQRRTYVYVPLITTYYTYGNIDFGTVKGFTFGYDLRRTNNVAMNINYTLQFADGTGSDANAQRGLTSRGNLRTLFPLSFDERHNIQASIDYRFPTGKEYVLSGGPRIAGINILQGVGANIIASSVSGTPYTAKEIPDKFGGGGTVGTINGARLPWKTTFDLKLDKNFAIGSKSKKLDVNAFLRIQNIFNTRNIKSVYSASGSAENDGYLQSTFGQQELQSLQASGNDTQSFLDAYHWALLSPGNFTQPRRVFLGMSFYF